ncbi:MAG: hypothetical protein QW213_06170 [Thermoproteota archaeon]
MSESISSIILTSALFLLMFALLASFLIVVNNVTGNYEKVRFNDIANYIARNIVDITTLCYESSYDNMSIGIVLQVPTEVNNKGYSINIIIENNVYEVLVVSDTNSFVYGKAPLWVTTGTQIQLSGTVIVPSIGAVYCKSKIYSGTEKIVVWASKQNGIIVAGIGTLKL